MLRTKQNNQTNGCRGNRTLDRLLKRQLLYRLSYAPTKNSSKLNLSNLPSKEKYFFGLKKNRIILPVQ